jgi:DnaJ-class molecular chaperone
LGVGRESARPEISKAYRKLAGKFHPDRYLNKDDKVTAEKKFLQIAAA